MDVSLRRLKIYNFRSFRGEHEISFPDRGLCLLSGQSGHGKSNVLIALAYALGCSPLPATAIQSWHDDDPFWVEAEFGIGGGVASIRRGPKSRLLTKPDGSEVKGAAAAVEQALDELLGAPVDIREFLTYRDQVEPMRFLTMDDKKVKSFLTKVSQAGGSDMDLGKVEAEIAKGVTRVNKLKGEVAVAAAAAIVARDALAQVQRTVVTFDPVDLDSHRRVLEEAVENEQLLQEHVKAATELLSQKTREDAELVEAARRAHEPALADARAAYAAIHTRPVVLEVETNQAEIKDKLQQCETYLLGLKTEDDARRRQYLEERAELEHKIRVHHAEQAKVPGLVDRSKRLRAEIDALDESKCPTCERQWSSAGDKAVEKSQELGQVMAALDELRGKVQAGRDMETRRDTMSFTPNAQVAQLEQIRGNLREELAAERQRVSNAAALKSAEVKRQIAEAKELVARLEREQNAAALEASSRGQASLVLATLRSLETQLATAKGAVGIASGRLAAAEYQAATNAAAERDFTRRVKAAEDFLATKEAETKRLEANFAKESDYLDMIRNFYNKVFGEFFQEAGVEATRMLATLPNADRLSLEFRSETETEREVVKSRFTPIVLVDGVPRTLREALSGGQTTSTRLAADLAVIRVIGRRLGVNLNWIVLDETFAGHDPRTKQACLELLQQYAKDKLVLVVDHTSETQELFNKRVEVIMENKESRMQVCS